jgi:hypothetical protein
VSLMRGGGGSTSNRRRASPARKPLSPMSPIEKQFDDQLLSKLFAIAAPEPTLKSAFDRIMLHWAGLNNSCYLELQKHPSFKTISADLKIVETLCTSLLEVSGKYHVEYELWRAADDYGGDRKPLDGADRVSVARQEIEKYRDWARVARNETSKKKLGRQSEAFRNQARQLAVTELGHIWQFITGRRPTRRVQNPASTRANAGAHAPQPYGPFQDFVRKSLLPIFGSHGVNGIDRDIRHTCHFMDKNPTAPPPSYIHMPRPPEKHT